jgi:hypothetical protein
VNNQQTGTIKKSTVVSPEAQNETQYTLFRDDFEDGNYDGWTDTSEGTVSVTDVGGKTNAFGGSGFTNDIHVYTTTTFTDFVMEFDYYATGDDGVFFRAQNSSDGYLLAIRDELYSDNVCQLDVYRRIADSWASVACASTNPSILDSTWYHYKIIADGSSFRVYKDDVLYINTTDGTFSQGRIGVRLIGSDTSYIDNIVVRPVLTATEQQNLTYARPYLLNNTAGTQNWGLNYGGFVSGQSMNSYAAYEGSTCAGTLITSGPVSFVHYADFEDGFDGWGGAQVNVGFERDSSTSYTGSYSTRVYCSGGACSLSVDIGDTAGTSTDFNGTGNYSEETYPVTSFAYKIPSGTPVCLFYYVDTIGWVSLGGTSSCNPGAYTQCAKAGALTDDNTWRVYSLNVDRLLDSCGYTGSYNITEFEWYTTNGADGQQFWFDDFSIHDAKWAADVTSSDTDYETLCSYWNYPLSVGPLVITQCTESPCETSTAGGYSYLKGTVTVNNTAEKQMNITLAGQCPGDRDSWVNESCDDRSIVVPATVGSTIGQTQETYYWRKSCISKTESSWSVVGTPTEGSQTIQKSVTIENNCGATMDNISWSATEDPSSCWTNKQTTGTISSLADGANITIYANQSGDCIDDGSWTGWAVKSVGTEASQTVRKTRTVTSLDTDYSFTNVAWTTTGRAEPCWTTQVTSGTYTLTTSVTIEANATGDCIDTSIAAYTQNTTGTKNESRIDFNSTVTWTNNGGVALDFTYDLGAADVGGTCSGDAWITSQTGTMTGCSGSCSQALRAYADCIVDIDCTADEWSSDTCDAVSGDEQIGCTKSNIVNNWTGTLSVDLSVTPPSTSIDADWGVCYDCNPTSVSILADDTTDYKFIDTANVVTQTEGGWGLNGTCSQYVNHRQYHNESVTLNNIGGMTMNSCSWSVATPGTNTSVTTSGSESVPAGGTSVLAQVYDWCNVAPSLTAITASPTCIKTGTVTVQTSSASDTESDPLTLRVGKTSSASDLCNSTSGQPERSCTFTVESQWTDTASHTLYGLVYDGYTISTERNTTITTDNSGPNAPTGLSPSSGTNTSDNTPTFGWSEPSDVGCNGTISQYNISIYTDSGCTSLYRSNLTSGTSYTFPDSIADNHYWWKVRAKDGVDNWGTWSSCIELTVDTQSCQINQTIR